MTRTRVVNITYHPFKKSHGYTFLIEPYCVKLFENRWYVLAHNLYYDDIRLYGLDRVETAETIEQTYKLPKDFDAAEYFSTAYGIV
ncbi:helix-turn-helix transcriptional regulator, partial [Paramuribaculum intestinale]|uniref:helix-turn-helix transcriptional regulator n=1 Tax=Paramuribaculum intestinale TaxID=2094151 RepID=UPI00272C646C